jgi:hypothetical protein
MTWLEYRESIEIDSKYYSFYGLLMATMRKADPENLEILKGGWPHIGEELRLRHKAPGGFLNTEEQR